MKNKKLKMGQFEDLMERQILWFRVGLQHTGVFVSERAESEVLEGSTMSMESQRAV